MEIAYVYLDIETMGLNAYEDRITCIGLIAESNNEILFEEAIFDFNEKRLLQKFIKKIEKLRKEYLPEMITWNGTTFDLPFISVRLLKYNLSNQISNVMYQDLKEEFPKFRISEVVKHPSLDDIAKFFNLKIKKTGHGSEAPNLFVTKQYEKLKSYCLNDVRILRLIHKRIEGEQNG